jgi:monomeric isocitrate dehydrogenase
LLFKRRGQPRGVTAHLARVNGRFQQTHLGVLSDCSSNNFFQARAKLIDLVFSIHVHDCNMKFIDKVIFLDCVVVFAYFLYSNDYEQVGVEKVETHIGEEVQVAEKEGFLS